MADLGTAYVQIVPSAEGISGSISSVLSGEATSAGTEAGGLCGSNILSALKGMLTVAAVASAVSAIKEAVNEVAEYGDEIDKTSQKVGLSNEAYQKWDYVMNLAGTSMSDCTTGMKTLTNQIDEAKNGSEDAQNMFSQLGISMDDLNSMSREDAFSAVITGLQGMEDSTERAALANDLFGKSGQNLTPLFNMTSEDTQELMENFEELGGVMSDDMVADSAAYEDALTTMKASMTGMKNNIIGSMLPSLTSLMNGFATVTGSLDLSPIAEQFSGIGQGISDFIANIDWERVSEVLNTIIEHVGKFIEGFKTGMQPAIELVKEAFSHLMEALQPVIQAIAEATGQTDTMNGAMTAGETVGMLLSGVITEIAGVIEVLAGIIKGVITVVNFFKDAIQTTKETFEELKNGITNAIETLKTDVTNGFNNIKDAIVTPIQNAYDTITGVLDNIKQAFKDKLDAAKDVVSDVIDSIKSLFNFSWSLPDLALPHFSVSGHFSLNPPSVPSFSISWYKKAMDSAMILDGATVFGASGGNLLAGGEAGREVVSGESHLIDLVSGAVYQQMSGIENLLLQYLPQCAQGLTIDGEKMASTMDTKMANATLRRASAW